MKVSAYQFFDLRSDPGAVFPGILEEHHQPRRIFGDNLFIGYGQLSLDDKEAFSDGSPDQISHNTPGSLIGPQAFGNHQRPELFHAGGMQIVIPEKLFHPQFATPVTVPEERSDPALIREGQLVVRAARQIMELVPDTPQI